MRTVCAKILLIFWTQFQIYLEHGLLQDFNFQSSVKVDFDNFFFVSVILSFMEEWNFGDFYLLQKYFFTGL